MIVKEPFTVEGYLGGYKDTKVVDKKDNEVNVENMTLKELTKKEEKKELFFQIEVEDRSLYLVRNTEISDRAKDFLRNLSRDERERVEKCAGWFMSLVGYFYHYSFFTKKLWQKVKGFKDADEAEVVLAFIQWWFRNDFGLQTQPCGCGWYGSFRKWDEEDECFEDYIEKYRPVFEAFTEWRYKQR